MTSQVSVPVHCKCGWTGLRRPVKIKARPCPACDGEVKRWRKLESQIAVVKEIASRYVEETPLESYIAMTNEPVPALPNPYVLRDFSGRIVGRFAAPRARKRAGTRSRR